MLAVLIVGGFNVLVLALIWNIARKVFKYAVFIAVYVMIRYGFGVDLVESMPDIIDWLARVTAYGLYVLFNS